MTAVHTGRALRIALITNSLPAEGRNSGGVAQVAHDLAEGLGGRGHSVTVWTYEAEVEPRNYAVRLLPGRRFAANRAGRILTEGYLGNVFTLLPRYREADAIVTMGDSLLLPLLGKPLVRVMHGSALAEAATAGTLLRSIAQIGIYPQELITALTQPGCVGVSENTRRYNPFVRRVIPNGTDLSSFRPAADEKSVEPSVLFVGTMGGRKRGALLLDRFVNQVRPGLPSASLTIVGPPGPSAAGVEYRTGIPKSELASLYRRSWIYASPSAYEGFGLPYIEALASGTPVVATGNPGSREVLVDGEYGILVEDAEFGPTLLNLLQDGARRERMASAGIERAAEFSLDRMIDAYERLLLDLQARSSVSKRRAPSMRD